MTDSDRARLQADRDRITAAILAAARAYRGVTVQTQAEYVTYLLGGEVTA